MGSRAGGGDLERVEGWGEVGSRLRQQDRALQSLTNGQLGHQQPARAAGWGRSWRHQVKISSRSQSQAVEGGEGSQAEWRPPSLETGKRWHSRVASLVLEV